jgi:hypothetical protein
MDKRIIFKNDQGGVSIIVPSKEAVDKHGIYAVAKKDVPSGNSFKIVDAKDIPEDRTFRDAWEVDAATLTDGVGSVGNEFGE